MSYKKLLKQVAEEYCTSADDVACEIKRALEIANLDIEPSLLIALATMNVKKTIYRK